MASGPGSLTRRTILRLAGSAVTIAVTPISAWGWQAERQGVGNRETAWSGVAGQAKHRIDGMAKVLGRKIYARDFRARDMDGWPSREQVATVLYAAHVDRTLLGYNLDFLPPGLRPQIEVDAARLAQDKIQDLFPDTSPEGYPAGFMAAFGARPVYLGQPIAILIFENADVFRRAYRLLQFRKDVVQYGKVIGARDIGGAYKHPNHLTYLEGHFSKVEYGRTNPYEATPKGANLKAKQARTQIEEQVAASDWSIYTGHRSTQRIVPMFMEPESGLGWLDGETLHLVLGTQSPNGDVKDGLELFDGEGCPLKVKTVELTSCYPGGGFGGRDVSPFTPTLMLAAAYANGPVRLAHDRFAQFQVGLTQLPAEVEQHIAVDKEGMFQSLHTITKMPSGGKNNYSQFVAGLAGYSAGGAYNFPRAIVDARAVPTHEIVAGSMRGFGGVQAAFALETMVDEIAHDRGQDPIELRQQNALDEAGHTVTGAPMLEPMRIQDICERARANPLWKGRAARKAEVSTKEELYGVGFALANQAYGTGNDGVFGNVRLERGGEILVRTTAVDMGQGSATSLALGPAHWLGSNATSIEMGRVAIFGNIVLNTSAEHKPGKRMATGMAESKWDDPEFTPSISMSSSACITAFQQFHATTQAAQVLYETGVLPMAAKLWGLQPDAAALAEAHWKDGTLQLQSMRALPMAEIAEALYSQGGIVESMLHAYFSGTWVSARYEVDGTSRRWPIDALLTLRAGQSEYDRHLRHDVDPPKKGSENYGRSLYAPSASIVALSVNRTTGLVKLHDIYTYLDAGKVIQPDLVSGQYQGGVAMGVGYALLEDLPPGPEGAGNGRWNLNRYHVPLAADLPLDRTQLEILEPVGKNPTSKGIAEAVLCPIAPAIANALCHASGHVFTSLPITPAKIREALNS